MDGGDLAGFALGISALDEPGLVAALKVRISLKDYETEENRPGGPRGRFGYGDNNNHAP